MAVKIPKAMDRSYLSSTLHDFEDYTLHEILKDQKIIDVAEDYTRATSTDPGALLVVNSTTPGTGEVAYLTVVAFISDIAIGEYVIHTDEVSHIADVRVQKYAPLNGTDQEDPDWWDTTGEQTTAYKSLINDSVVSSVSLYSSQKTVDSINDAETSLKTYIDEKLAKQISVSIKYVTALPSDPQENVLYVYNNGTSNIIYLYDGTQWVNTGVDLSSIDFSDYYKKSEVDTKLADYSKTAEVVLISDLKSTLDYPSAITTPSTKAVADAINKIISGGVDLTGYFKTENILQGITALSTSTVLSSQATDDNYIKQSKIVTDLDATVDDTQVVSAKTVKSALANINIMSDTMPTNIPDGTVWVSTADIS